MFSNKELSSQKDALARGKASPLDVATYFGMEHFIYIPSKEELATEQWLEQFMLGIQLRLIESHQYIPPKKDIILMQKCKR